MIAKGNTSAQLNDILSKVSEGDILAHYLGVYNVPTIINSPLRTDKRPSFGIYSKDGEKIRYTDFSTKDSGGIFDLLSKMWNCSYLEVLDRIDNDMNLGTTNTNIRTSCNIKSTCYYKKNSDLQCKVREWEDYDIKYWESYGISLEWLKWAEVWPISHKIVIKDGKKYVFKADKYAYAYVEHKENKVTLKIYQPYNKLGYKWSNKHDGSVISLWTKIPVNGDIVCICASLKDALCLSCNLKIPALAIQGEGYSISKTAVDELKRRFKNVYTLLDNDNAGLLDGEKLAKETGFTNIVLPQFEGGKDISDYYKCFGKEKFISTLKPLFYPPKKIDYSDDLPFDC